MTERLRWVGNCVMVAHAEALRRPFDGLRDWPAQQPAPSPLRGGRTPLGSLDNIALTPNPTKPLPPDSTLRLATARAEARARSQAAPRAARAARGGAPPRHTRSTPSVVTKHTKEGRHLPHQF